MVAVTLFCEALSIPALTLIRMQERSKLWVGLSFLRVGGSLALNVYFVVFAGLGIGGILLSNALAAAIILCLASAPLVGRRPIVFRWGVLAQMLRFGLPFVPVLLGVLIIDLSDRYLIQWLRTTAEVGVYSVGYKFGQIALIAVSAFSMGWAPLRYRIFERPDAKEIYVRIFRLYAAAASFGVVAISVFGDESVRLATTPAFFAGARVIPLVCGSYALYGMHILAATGMGVTKRTSGLTLAVVLAAVANLEANLLLIPRYGMMGAAAATLIAYGLMVLVTAWFSQRIYPVQYEWGTILRIAMATAGVIVVDSLLQPSHVVAGLGLAGLLLLAFTALLFVSGGLRQSDVWAFRHWVRDSQLTQGTD
jgi:O-antigen/teichoic acid export membrane protein